MRLSYGARSDPGLVRATNEDSYYASARAGLFVVADGMGGHSGGQVASAEAVRAFQEYLSAHVILPGGGEVGVEGSLGLSVLFDALRAANQRVLAVARSQSELEGMGTTLSAVWIRDSRAYICHVGDSRVYLLRAESLDLLTQDHSWVFEQYKQGAITLAEVRTHPMRNLITRSVGQTASVEPDLLAQEIAPGDMILLCTDGLTSMLDESQILSLLLDEAVPSLDEKCDVLIEMANQAGGLDNITVIVVRVERDES